ncbi:TIGR04282 family arsenosugar biosynthesis glycosyltransferase [Pontibacter harenae]|uniref:TIGR04282 family arsenosugar biosynthesis glycosyltransferase n=1 Tax=Pontibacter harenae TaxID=2894083 RepID=UPI001E51202E|nr:TIGR04282 family arsenosugar biosynthesis glycosyltransferase [Pontibacter harenae]MCC9166817.1 TIGR04282 family arsenosugar biosynthesis glycosyltransferase [Pontibacter harenae]
MKNKKLIMVFVRNPELGKVKTRLAASVGEEKALQIYLYLLEHTQTVTQHVEADKVVYYAERVEEHDLWPYAYHHKKLQPSGDLGEKMLAAFEAAFAEAYESVVIIGSDCQQLKQEIIEQAFDELQTHDVVIGPAVDGGYYLLGMNRLYPDFFQNKHWSTDQVFTATIEDIERLEITYSLLPTLKDVDYLEDLEKPEQWLNMSG